MVLMQLLQLAFEQEAAAIDPMRQPAPERKGPFPPGSLGYDQEQLSPVGSHYTWPFGDTDVPQITDFGNA
jgi:hypothetical protein